MNIWYVSNIYIDKSIKNAVSQSTSFNFRVQYIHDFSNTSNWHLHLSLHTHFWLFLAFFFGLQAIVFFIFACLLIFFFENECYPYCNNSDTDFHYPHLIIVICWIIFMNSNPTHQPSMLGICWHTSGKHSFGYAHSNSKMAVVPVKPLFQ